MQRWGNMTCDEVMSELEALGSAQTRKVLRRHGAVDPFFGVKIGDLKPLAKKLKGRQELALELYATGNSDAQYLAGLIADGAAMTQGQLNTWARTAAWSLISGSTVAWVAAEHPRGFALARKWIDAKKESVARSGWATLAVLTTVVADDHLPVDELRRLLDRVVATIHDAPGDVAYVMNNFVICVGTYVAPLGDIALETAQQMGEVKIDMGETACQVPDAAPYILKSRRSQPIAPKRKSARC
jgi:hypothetical protein